MPKLTTKESTEMYALGQKILRDRFPGPAQCLWEFIKPRGTSYFVIAGYQVTYKDKARLVILQILKGGWTIYAAPHTNGVDEAYKTISCMWNINDAAKPIGDTRTVADDLVDRIVCDAKPNLKPSKPNDFATQVVL